LCQSRAFMRLPAIRPVRIRFEFPQDLQVRFTRGPPELGPARQIDANDHLPTSKIMACGALSRGHLEMARLVTLDGAG